MTNTVPESVDSYIASHLLGDDAILDAVLAANAAAGLPAIDVSPAQGKLLNLLARIAGARRILEVGTLGGYSSIWLARALPADGTLVTLEIDPHHVAVARANIAAAGLEPVVDVRQGPAADSLAKLVADAAEPFDLVFIDADKPGNVEYVTRALQLSRPGTVIIVDNVVRGGAVVDADSLDPSVQGTRRLFELLSAKGSLDATAIQTVGLKGHDGFLIGVVR
ncbi:MAG: O-methyltransferase [Sphingobium sp.]